MGTAHGKQVISLTRDPRTSAYIFTFDRDHRDDVEDVLMATVPTQARTIDRIAGAWHIADTWTLRAAEALLHNGFTVTGNLPGGR